MTAVRNGQVDATLQDVPAALFYRDRFPGLELAVPASELRNKPVVTQNDLFELPVRLNP